MNTVVETPSFLNAVSKVWDESERMEFIYYIAKYCKKGDVIPGTGGIRKIRYGREDIGKRGGVRVIYYYYDSSAPLYLLYAYPKSAKENLTPEDTKLLKGLAHELKTEIQAKGGNRR